MAAYYQMKYQNLTYDDAIELMNAHGKYMMFHPKLREQVHELWERIQRERREGQPKQTVAAQAIPAGPVASVPPLPANH
jgi:hypothetical protein